MSWIDDVLDKGNEQSQKEKMKEATRKMVHIYLAQGFDWTETEYLIMANMSTVVNIGWLLIIQKWIREIKDEEREVLH